MATPKLMILSVTLASALMATAPAMADVKTTDVRYSDLDLSSAEGRDRLQLRIKQAVKRVCSSPRAFTIEERLDQQNCQKAAYVKAASQSERAIAAYMAKRRLALGNTVSDGTN